MLICYWKAAESNVGPAANTSYRSNAMISLTLVSDMRASFEKIAVQMQLAP